MELHILTTGAVIIQARGLAEQLALHELARKLETKVYLPLPRNDISGLRLTPAQFATGRLEGWINIAPGVVRGQWWG